MIHAPANAEIIQLITKNGNIINVEIPQASQSRNNNDGNSTQSDAQSMIDGMGIQTNIIQIEYDAAKITHGIGMLGRV